jgi:hypothetical protein
MLDLGQVQHFRVAASQLSASATQPATTRPAGAVKFDHGPDFRGRPSRREIPERCGSCHSDVAMMNPYGLPTDQLAQYRASGHGQALYLNDNQRVAVCVDCHGKHAILPPKDPASSVNPRSIPATCGRCHADPAVMAGTGRSTRVVDQYRQSVHGQALLEKGDLAMPQCATCHGSHSAVPPGFRDVGQVCGRCHQQEQQRFLESVHAQFPMYPRCVACHTSTPDMQDHQIVRRAASPPAVRKAFDATVQAMPSTGIDQPAFADAYAARREPRLPSFEVFCQRCHTAANQAAHRAFFAELDQRVAGIGAGLYQNVRRAEIRYAATAARVDQVAHGVLLVTDEALMLEEARTKLVSIGPLQHTLDVDKVTAAVGELDSLTAEIDRSLDRKLKGLHWRYWALVPLWLFVAFFVSILWVKYKRLKHEMVAPLDSVEDSSCGPAEKSRA